VSWMRWWWKWHRGFGEVGAPALAPGLSVVQLAPGVGALAAVGGAGGVDQAERGALGLVEEAFEPSEVEDS